MSTPSISWKTALRAEAAEAAARRRWGLALATAGWSHLAWFLACQAIVDPARKSNPLHLALWLGDLGCLLLICRLACGPGWWREGPATTLVVRLWGTFLILCFNVMTLNALTGWDHNWFKPVWATLSTFGFATTAWLFSTRLILPAVQMYATALLMVALPGWSYLIYGVSWFLALQGLGAMLPRRRDAPAAARHVEGPGRNGATAVVPRQTDCRSPADRSS